MPYRLTADDWREMLGPHAEEKHLAWRYRLANLALVGATTSHRDPGSRIHEFSRPGRSGITGLNSR